MNAWLPRASYPCGNSSDTSCIKLVKSKGSIGLLSQSVFILKIKIKRAFALLLYARFLRHFHKWKRGGSPVRPAREGTGIPNAADLRRPVLSFRRRAYSRPIDSRTC
ncbi:hypothetical protein JTE90_016587 [Oedothorax gibbosus]|uniref:Uncharacterized protein n=1 Tax=Oedothorax gibbosus TaxID=931172 RepID=A0AAV6TIC8_9ARAC|nr:hypothetical protein JTE90_016587 [Oedothorax gibbosus]